MAEPTLKITPNPPSEPFLTINSEGVVWLTPDLDTVQLRSIDTKYLQLLRTLIDRELASRSQDHK